MANYTLDENYNNKTPLRKFWPIVKENFAKLLSWFNAHVSGTADRHKAEHIDYDSSTTVKQKIAQEITDRQNGDSALQNKITAETTARESADTELCNRVNYIDAVLNSSVMRVHYVDLRDEGASIQDSFSLDDCVPEEYGSNEMYFVLYETKNISSETELHSVLLCSTYCRLDGNTAYVQYYTDVYGVTYTRYTMYGELDNWSDWRRSNPDYRDRIFELDQQISALESRISALEPPSGSSVAYVRT